MTRAVSFAQMRADLADAEATIDILKGALAGMDITGLDHPAWAAGLTHQGRAIMGLLISKWPRSLTTEEIADRIPGHVDGCSSLGSVVVGVYHIRRQLGHEAVVSIRSEGYRLGDEFMAGINRHGA